MSKPVVDLRKHGNITIHDAAASHADVQLLLTEPQKHSLYAQLQARTSPQNATLTKDFWYENK